MTLTIGYLARRAFMVLRHSKITINNPPIQRIVIRLKKYAQTQTLLPSLSFLNSLHCPLISLSIEANAIEKIPIISFFASCQ